ncbi:MAG: HAD-IB family phosphatase, partial [Leadbetterella sp.]
METHTEKRYFIIDFDSTITKVEGLDQLAIIALKGNPEGKSIAEKIKSITDLGMNGEISFSEAIQRRIALLKANKSHIDTLVEFLKNNITDSFERNKSFLQQYADQIIIISGGFVEFINPVIEFLGLKTENVYANSFVFDSNDDIIGIDQSNPLANSGGKIKLLESLKLDGHISVIGDGYTDYELKKSGEAHRFYAFIENVKRENVLPGADFVINSLDEFLFYNQ